MSPIILKPKILLQNLCKQGLNWDDDISNTETVQWQAWLQTLTQLQKYTVSRCYKPIDFGRITFNELHHFSDASTNAYGACSYLRIVDDHALRRLTSRKGKLQQIYSDNGTNFVRAEKILRDSLQLWNQSQIHDYLRQHEVRW